MKPQKTLPRVLRWALPAGIGLALGLAAVSATAAVLAVDDFEEYAPGAGSSLLGQNGGLGWAGPWGHSLGNTANVIDTATDPLTFTPEGGQPLSGGHRAVAVFGGNNVVTAVRPLDSPAPDVFYASYLLRTVSGIWDGNNTFSIHFSNSASDTSSLNFGIRSNPSGPSSSNHFLVRTGTGNPPEGGATGGFLDPDTTYLLVARISKLDGAGNPASTYDRIEIWLNPGVGAMDAAPEGDARLQLAGGSGVSAITHVLVRAAALQANDVIQFDGLRLTAEWPLTLDDGVQIVNISPADGATFVDPALGFQFEVLSPEAVVPENVRLTLNGVDVSGDLSITVTDTGATVVFSGLEADIFYTAEIEVTVGAETRQRTISFDTRSESLQPAPYISEFMAANSTTLADEEDDYSDWIEIHNPGAAPVSLQGWFLTDNANNLTKWAFPEVTLPADSYLVVFASGKDRQNPSGRLHTNFRLARDGEYLALVRPDGASIVSEFAPYPPQLTDISYGFMLGPGGGSALVPEYFTTPTPGAANVPGVRGIVPEVRFEPERGFYDAPFILTLSNDMEDAEIRFTTDGTPPTATTGSVYTEPIMVSGTMVIRAAAFRPEYKTPGSVTHSYFFIDEVIRQPRDIPGWPRPMLAVGQGATRQHDYGMDPRIVDAGEYHDDLRAGLLEIPTLSIVVHQPDMWDQNGAGGFYRRFGLQRPASVELIYPDAPEKNVFATAFVQGHSHDRLKRSLRLRFDSPYFPSKFVSTLLQDAPVNGDSATDELEHLVLRAGNNRAWSRIWNPDRTTYTEDQWYRDTQIAMSGFGCRGNFVHLYINGLYWGLYNPSERTNRAYVSSYFGGRKGDWFAVNHGGPKGDGDPARWNYLRGPLISKDLSIPGNYAELKEYLAVEYFIDYLLVTWYIGMTDWPNNNWWGANRNNPPGPFYFFAWDGEWSWGVGSSPDGAWVHPDFRASGGNTTRVTPKIWHAVRRNSDFMMLVADRTFQHVSSGALSNTSAQERWTILNDYIRNPVVAESARWGDSIDPNLPRTRDVDWQNEVDWIRQRMIGNGARLIAAMRAEGFYPNINAPTFSAPAGTVAAGSEVSLENPNASGTIYYTLDGSDPRLSGGSVNPEALTGPIQVNHNVTVKARVFHNGEWSALAEAAFRIDSPAPYPLGEAGPYFLEQWNADEPAESYPPHMMFYQTSVQDPALDTEMESVWTLPYDLTSRSRVNGLGEAGFAFINTSNPQDSEGAGYLGAAVLAVDTLGLEEIYVTWTGGTVIPNSRIYGIRLQFRTGAGQEFEDVLDQNGNPVDYIRNEEAGHFATIGPVKLPDSANNQSRVELRWKYYYISGDSGARAMLRLGGIQVSAGHPAAQALVFLETPAVGQAGHAFGPVIVQAQTEGGMIATGFEGLIEISVTGGAGGISGVLQRQAENGRVTFDDLIFNQHGVHTLTASGADLIAGVSQEIRMVTWTEVILPQYIQGEQPENNNRVPFAFRISLAGLKPNATYRYGNRIVVAGDPMGQNGAGNMIFVKTNGGHFIRNTDAPRFQADDLDIRHGEFVTSAEGNYTGWFITEPSGNWRFTPGETVFIRLLLNDGAGGEAYRHFLTGSSPVEVIEFGVGDGQASGLHGLSSAAGKNFVVLYGDAHGTSRPLAAGVVEATGAEVDSRYAAFYEGIVAGRAGRWGTLIPNGLEAGVRRIENRDLVTGEIVSVFVAPGGILASRNMNAGINAVGVRVPGPEDSGYSIWQARQFTLSELADESVSGAASDPGESGFPNLWRYALGLDLLDPADGTTPTAHLEEIGGQMFLSFRHRRLIGESGLDYVVQLSGDLDEWTNADGELIEMEEPEPVGDGLTEVVTWGFPIGAGSAQLFLRLRVSLR